MSAAAPAAAAAPATTTLIRASVQGIVFLIESASGKVYTYNLEKPTYVGVLEKIPEEDKHLISKTNGCLANARVKYRSDIREVMKALRAGVAS
jgi:hypothetical protein